MRSSPADKIRENTARRYAARRGLLVVKSMRRDPGAFDYGKYVLVPDTRENPAPRGGGEAAIRAFALGECMTLDELEAELNKPAEALPAEAIRWRFKESPLKATEDRLDEHAKEYAEKLNRQQLMALYTVREALLDLADRRV
jgi:hypothetical protein